MWQLYRSGRLAPKSLRVGPGAVAGRPETGPPEAALGTVALDRSPWDQAGPSLAWFDSTHWTLLQNIFHYHVKVRQMADRPVCAQLTFAGTWGPVRS